MKASDRMLGPLVSGGSDARGEHGRPASRRVKIACIQMEPVVGDKQRNLQKSLAMIEEAASQGARLVVLPELCNSGYVFASRDEFELAEPVDSGATSRAWSESRARGLHIVAGSASEPATCSTTARS